MRAGFSLLVGTFVGLSSLTIVCQIEVATAQSWSFTKATFIPPAHPPLVECSTTTALQARKKAAAPAASKKVQVKLLKHVAGTGQAGEVVMVTPPFYNNKLRPTKSAVLISDEEVDMERVEAALAEKELTSKAESIKEQVEGALLTLKRKAGPDGQLFGGIGAKNIIEELKETTGEDDFLGGKTVKITALMDGDGKKMRGDIKHTGSFQATLSWTKDIKATVAIQVEAES